MDFEIVLNFYREFLKTPNPDLKILERIASASGAKEFWQLIRAYTYNIQLDVDLKNNKSGKMLISDDCYFYAKSRFIRVGLQCYSKNLKFFTNPGSRHGSYYNSSLSTTSYQSYINGRYKLQKLSLRYL